MIGRTQHPSPKSLKVYHCMSKLPEIGGSGQAETIWKIFLNCIILPCDLATNTRVYSYICPRSKGIPTVTLD